MWNRLIITTDYSDNGSAMPAPLPLRPGWSSRRLRSIADALLNLNFRTRPGGDDFSTSGLKTTSTSWIGKSV